MAIGVNEIDGGTLYNTLLYLDADGRIAGRHRKLMPTGGERTVWGFGDGSTLDVVRTEFGVVGGLICWENYMPLARAAMYAQGVDIYLAPTWDNSDTWIATLRHIAKEGGVHVIGVAPAATRQRRPGRTSRRHLRRRGRLDESRHTRPSSPPPADVLAGPLLERKAFSSATIDVAQARTQRRMFDAVGHYARPDVFTLTVNTAAQQAVRFTPEQ